MEKWKFFASSGMTNFGPTEHTRVNEPGIQTLPLPLDVSGFRFKVHFKCVHVSKNTNMKINNIVRL